MCILEISTSHRHQIILNIHNIISKTWVIQLTYNSLKNVRISSDTRAVVSCYASIINCMISMLPGNRLEHGDVIKWRHFPRNWPFVRGIHRSPVNSPHKGQWHGALILSLICAWINRWVNNCEAGDFRRYRAQYDVIVMMRARFVPNWLYLSITKKNTLHHILINHTNHCFRNCTHWTRRHCLRNM